MAIGHFLRLLLGAESEHAPKLTEDATLFCVTFSRIGHLLVTLFLLDSGKLYALTTFEEDLLVGCQVDRLEFFMNGLSYRFSSVAHLDCV